MMGAWVVPFLRYIATKASSGSKATTAGHQRRVRPFFPALSVIKRATSTV